MDEEQKRIIIGGDDGMSERFSDWCKCKHCVYQALVDRAVCSLTYDYCKREDCEKIYGDVE